MLASRVAAYQQAVTSTDPPGLPVRVWGAAGISLRPLASHDVRTYLRRGAASAAARWNPVLATLGTNAPVAQALTTPLLVGLARAIYNPRPGEHTGVLPDPAELCDSTQFPTRAAIQEHLFDGFIPAAYRPHPDPASRCPWTGKQAERWLVFLARYLEQDRHGTTDLAWWELYRTTPARPVGLVFGFGFGLVFGLGFGLVFGLVGGLGVRLGLGLGYGLMLGLMGRQFVLNLFSAERSPAKGLRWERPFEEAIIRGLVVWLVVGLVAGLVVWLVYEVKLGVGLLVGLGFGLVVGLGFGLLGRLSSEPAGLAVAADPYAVYARDRATFWTFGLVVGLVVGLGLGLVTGVLSGGLLVVLFGDLLVVGLVVGFVISASQTAFVPFVMARCWQALGRRLPWRLMSFLADAHRLRGVLRQAGAVYQFRHIDLQRRLARRPGP